MQIYGWELLKICQYLGKFSEHKYCDTEDVVFFICSVTSRELLKGLYEFNNK